MKTTLTTSQTQQLKITPQLQQAIRLLQLSSQALELEINTQLDKNPFLELDQEQSTDLSENSSDTFGGLGAEGSEVSEVSEASEALGSSDSFSSDTDYSYDNREYQTAERSRSDHFQEHQEWLINRETETTLRQHLLWQLTMGNFSENERLVATLLIDEINEEGYFACTLEEIQISFIQQYPEYETLSLDEIEVVLQRIQHFDPLGVGARSLMECLSIQLTSLPKQTSWAKEAIHALQHLDLIGKRDYTRLKKELRLDDTGLKGVLKVLKAQNPKPGSCFLTKRQDYIVPDLIVRKKNGRFVVELNMKTIPKLRLNSEYINLMNRVGTERSNTILKAHFNEARLFLNSLKHRQDTLLNVAEHIVHYQQAFFEYGAAKLRPLILQTIANDCGIHESTVSRITSQKYIDSPRGMFELKYFFSSAACENRQFGNASTSISISTKAIQAEVRKLIEHESPTNPLTDDTITKRLSIEGIHISRRTVTKYREKMKIKSSHDRRSLNLFNDIDPRRTYDDAHSNYRQTFKPNPNA